MSHHLAMRTAPDYIQFYPTLRCNQSCEFCFNRTMPFAQDMSFDDFRIMLGRLRDSSIRTIDIIGGEPTMHPDMILFLREACSKGFRVNISSNGTNINLLKEILNMGNQINVGISINDKVTFDHLQGFIKKHKPIVKTVFSPDKDFSMVQDILSLKPTKFYLIYRDAMMHQGLRETLPFHEFMKIVQKDINASLVGTVFCSGFIPDVENYPELSTMRCSAGTTKLGVMPDGSVYPCNLLFGRGAFLLGNILTDSFDVIWNHRALDFFRTFARNDCPVKACTHHAICHGGCPAHSLIHFGDVSAPDPRCVVNWPACP
jgi:radical SAM protein with 4Fe4S-binding SPASM domain